MGDIVRLTKEIDIDFSEYKTVNIKLTRLGDKLTQVHRSYEVFEHDMLVTAVSDAAYTIEVNIDTVKKSMCSNSGFSVVKWEDLEF